MKYQHKDRFSYVVSFLIFGALGAFITLKYQIGKKPKIIASIMTLIVVASLLYAIYLLFASPRIHNKEVLRGKKIDVLPEDDCRFRAAKDLESIDQKVEGIRIDGVRFKTSNGCDFYYENETLKPAGFGTKIIVALASDGQIKEPDVIQPIDCWN